jgi:hypothetical protein
MTKTELKGKPVTDLRYILSEHFEGITDDTTLVELKELVDDNWEDWLEEAMNPESPVAVEARLAQPNMATDLYSGRPRE